MLDGLMIGTLLLGGLLYVTLHREDGRIDRWLNLKAIDKFVAPEHRQLFKDSLKDLEAKSIMGYLPLLATAIGLVGVWVGMRSDWVDFNDASMTLAGVFSTFSILFVLGHGAYSLLIGAIIFAVFLDVKKNPRVLLPQLSEYLTDKEAKYLFWLRDKENKYSSSFLEKNLVTPEFLVPLLEQRALFTTHADLYNELEKSLSNQRQGQRSPEYKERQEQLLAQLKAKGAPFAPFYDHLLDAVLKFPNQSYRSKEGAAKPVSFSDRQEQWAEDIEALSSEPLMPSEEDAATSLITSELERIQVSAGVSRELREEASELLNQLESRQLEKQTRGMSDDLEAMTILEASRRHFGIPNAVRNKGA